MTAAARSGHKELQEQLKELLWQRDAVFDQDSGALSEAVADPGIPPVIVVPFDTKR